MTWRYNWIIEPMNKSVLRFAEKMELATPMSNTTRKFSIPLRLIDEDVDLFHDDFKELFFRIDRALMRYGYKCIDIQYQAGVYYVVVDQE
jgi:hypothetical protein